MFSLHRLREETEVFDMVRLPSESIQPKGYWHKVIGGGNLLVIQASFMSVLAGVETVFPATFFLEPEEQEMVAQVSGEVIELEWLDVRRVNLTLLHGSDRFYIRGYNHVAYKGDLGVAELDGYVPHAKQYPQRFEVDEDVRVAFKGLRRFADNALSLRNGPLYEDARQILRETEDLARLIR